MLRVDLDTREVVASVRDLIQEPLEVPRAAGVLAGARALLGTDVHRLWRERREAAGDGFRAEVGVALETEVDGFRVRLRGRADGVLERDGRVVVEEVKSVERTDEPGDLADARMQVRLYALCLARAAPAVAVRARLVLVSILDGSTREVAVPFDRAAVERALEDLVRRRVESARERRARAAARRRAAAALCFPYAEPRPHQQTFSDAVAGALESGRPLLATAPTGVGKTIAALLPALRFALERDVLLFFLTAKTTQQALVARTFVDVAEASGLGEGAVQALTFREKRGMCPPGDLLCQPDHCSYLAGFLERKKRERALADLLDGRAHLAPEDVLASGTKRTICPYALALAATMRVDLVICDLNYVYDPAVAFSLFDGDGAGREVAVVLDEAHNLFDRAREHHSPYLGRQVLLDEAARARTRVEAQSSLPFAGSGGLFEGLALHLEGLAGSIDRILAAARAEPTGALDGRRVAADVSGWEAACEESAAWLVRTWQHQQAEGLARPDDPVIGALERALAIRNLLRLEERELVPYVSEDEPGFGILCVDPARRLEARHRRVTGTVAMSATLEPLDYYADVLGLAPLDPVRLSLPSPFPEEHRCVALLPTVSTTWRERRRHHDAIARAIEETIAVRPGSYVAYFPSFRFLADVRARLRVDEGRLLVQTPRMGPAARDRLLGRMRDGREPRLLLAVAGGIFAEGVDLPGEALVGAIVVGPSLPQVGFERALMQHHFEETAGRGFAYAMLFPGMLRVVQAAGRVHRTPDDRGVIVLLGRRFARPPYVDCLPAHWMRYGPEELVTTDLSARLAAFWGVSDPASR